MFLVSLKNYEEKYLGKKERAIDDWKMTARHKEQYEKNPNIKHVEIKFLATNWEWSL